MKNKQQNLFHKIKGVTFNLNLLAGFVQNDFDRMLEEGYITKEELKTSIDDVHKQVALHKETLTIIGHTLNEIEHQIVEIINHYIKE